MKLSQDQCFMFTFLGLGGMCLIGYLISLDTTAVSSRFQEEEQTKRDIALSPAAQVAREEAALSIELEKNKLKKFYHCLAFIKKSSTERIEDISEQLNIMGCAEK